MAKDSIIVVYNANGSLGGKLHYAYKKMTCNESCAACDLTHGPTLSLSEQPGWKTLREGLQRDSYTVHQKHRNELDQKEKDWLRQDAVELPCVFLDDDVGNKRLLLSRPELDDCKGDLHQFEELLRQRLAKQ